MPTTHLRRPIPSRSWCMVLGAAALTTVAATRTVSSAGPLGARLSDWSRAPSSRASRGTTNEVRRLFAGGSGLLRACSHFSDTLVGAAPVEWANDLSPIAAADWNGDRAAHLLERAGFGGTPEEIRRFAAMTPRQAVDALVDFESIKSELKPFDESGIWDPGMDPFPPSRAEAVRIARAGGLESEHRRSVE